MSSSAFTGKPPANHDDYLIVRGFLVLFGMAGKLDPNKGLRIDSPSRPPPSEYHFETQKPRLIGGASVCIFLMLLVTGARLTLRARITKLHFGADDWLIMLGCITGTAGPAVLIASVMAGGIGKHIYDVTYQEYHMFTTLAPVRSLALYVSLAFVKLSIIAFYMRLNGFTSRKWMIAHCSLLSYVTALLITSICLFVFRCRPIRAQWDMKYLGTLNYTPKCLNLFRVIIALNVWHITSDAVLLIVPVAMLWKVQMKWSSKFRVWVAGVVGCINIILSIVRTIMNQNIDSDITWNYVKLNSWAIAEITVGVITASLPVLSVLVTKFFIWIDRNTSTASRGKYVFDRARKVVKRRADSIALDESLPMSSKNGEVVTTRYREEYEGEPSEDAKEHSNPEDLERGATGKRDSVVYAGHGQ